MHPGLAADATARPDQAHGKRRERSRVGQTAYEGVRYPRPITAVIRVLDRRLQSSGVGCVMFVDGLKADRAIEGVSDWVRGPQPDTAESCSCVGETSGHECGRNPTPPVFRMDIQMAQSGDGGVIQVRVDVDATHADD